MINTLKKFSVVGAVAAVVACASWIPAARADDEGAASPQVFVPPPVVTTATSPGTFDDLINFYMNPQTSAEQYESQTVVVPVYGYSSSIIIYPPVTQYYPGQATVIRVNRPFSSPPVRTPLTYIR